MSIFTQPSASKEVVVAKKIDNEVRRAAITLKQCYDSIRQLIYNNPSFQDEYAITDSDAIYTAFATNTTTGLSPTELGQAARAVKALVNQFAPGTIEDDVTPASITF